MKKLSDICTDKYGYRKLKINESLAVKLDNTTDIVNDIGIEKIDEEKIDEIFGGIAGYLVGPSVGRSIAKALGVEKGLLYDFLTSRLTGAALGDSIEKQLKNRH